jgi:hypothetical protein
VVHAYRNRIPELGSSTLKFMRNFKRSKGTATEFLGKNGSMGYGSTRKIYEAIGLMLNPPLKLTPGTGRTTGITLMSRVGLSDENICLTSGHKDPKVMRRSYLQPGVDQMSLGSMGLQFSRQQQDERREIDLVDDHLPELQEQEPGLLEMLAQAAGPSPVDQDGQEELPVASAVLGGEDPEVIEVPVDRGTPEVPRPKPRRPNFSLKRRKRPRPAPSQEKENMGPEEPCFSLSQPTPRSSGERSSTRGILTTSSNYMSNLSVFNSQFPCSSKPPTPSQPKVTHMSGTFTNCTFVMSGGKEN